MVSDIGKHEAVAKRISHELREYAVTATYLYVCFGALILYKAAILYGQGISYAPFGLAAIKAVVLAKFILVGHAMRIGDRFKRRALARVIARKSLLFLVMLLILSIVEEAIVGIVRGRSAVASLGEVAGDTWLQILANCLIMLLILVPYITFYEIREFLGEGRLRQMLFENHAGP
jgi:hypothetical protein